MSRLPDKKHNLVDKICRCGKSYQAWPYESSRSKFCSKPCLGKYNTKFIGHVVPRVIKNCLICKKDFGIERWRLKENYRGKYCSTKCRSQRTGNLASNWRGGIDKFYRDLRRSPQYQHIRRDMLKDANCYVCGSLEKLEVDHITPIAIRREGLMDRGNLQVLCKICHKAKTAVDIIDIREFRLHNG